MKKLELSSFQNGVLIIVPHSDDEILMSGGLMYMLQKAGIPVHVVLVTNGDYECKDFSKGWARLKEAQAGVMELGLEDSQLIFLGYADTGMPHEDSFLMGLLNEKSEEKIYVSSCSSDTYSIDGKPEFHWLKHREHAAYSRAMVKQDLKEVIEEYRPDVIFTTAEKDVHGDHAALIPFLQEVLETETSRPEIYCGVIHSLEGDETWPIPGTERYTRPLHFEDMGLDWEERYVLDLPKELTRRMGAQNLKQRALEKYKVALEPDAVDFLMAFIKDEELFWKVE